MRISDWSSDVCSSDLGMGGEAPVPVSHPRLIERHGEIVDEAAEGHVGRVGIVGVAGGDLGADGEMIVDRIAGPQAGADGGSRSVVTGHEVPFLAHPHIAADIQSGQAESVIRPGRSEEHTSELPSLMRISSAVFCLKKKK